MQLYRRLAMTMFPVLVLALGLAACGGGDSESDAGQDTAGPNDVSDPGTPYPKWMVLQLDAAEDPRPKLLYPERYVDGGPWKDLRGTTWTCRW